MDNETDALTRRQTQVMRAVHMLGEGSVSEVQTALEADGIEISYAATKSALRTLLREGRLRAHRRGRAMVYAAAGSRVSDARAALVRWMRTFFDGDASAALTTFLNAANADVSPEELQRLRALLDRSAPDARSDPR